MNDKVDALLYAMKSVVLAAGKPPANTHCKACGIAFDAVPNGLVAMEDTIDGLCSYSREPDKKACYGSFVDFARDRCAIEVRYHIPGYTHAMVEWSRAEVCVAFDSWLEAGRPTTPVTREAMPF